MIGWCVKQLGEAVEGERVPVRVESSRERDNGHCNLGPYWLRFCSPYAASIRCSLVEWSLLKLLQLKRIASRGRER